MTAGIEMSVNERLRQLPSVDRLLGEEPVQGLIPTYGHDQTVSGLRETLDTVRDEVRGGADVPSLAQIVSRTSHHMRRRFAPTLRPVINATGVIVHTNLGRAPLSTATQAAMEMVSRYREAVVTAQSTPNGCCAS